ncbi:MAG TPA: PQQ-binding-like beta-propeller repeat protein, partial [Candidatus Anammoximicrobium sp.]|nr:PQQ-binding-like beta-propeller repeat protein [Candidatus Anammoximicrobium sp.]
MSSQGYMLASQDRLYVPTGRTAPAIFARADGKSLGSLPEGSGAAVLFDARDVVSGPSVRPPGVTFADAQSRETIAAFDALRVVVRGSTVYLQSEDKLTALDCAKYIALSRESKSLTEEEKRLNAARKAQEKTDGADERLDIIQARLKEIAASKKQCFLWSVRCDCPWAMMLAGESLLLGGRDRVLAVDAADGKTIWSTAVAGAAHGLAAAGGRLWVSTDQGVIHCFRPMQSGAREPAPGPAPAVQRTPDADPGGAGSADAR